MKVGEIVEDFSDQLHGSGIHVRIYRGRFYGSADSEADDQNLLGVFGKHER